jgi:hypothetical protein
MASSETAFEAYLARDTRGEFRDLGPGAGEADIQSANASGERHDFA